MKADSIKPFHTLKKSEQRHLVQNRKPGYIMLSKRILFQHLVKWFKLVHIKTRIKMEIISNDNKSFLFFSTFERNEENVLGSL